MYHILFLYESVNEHLGWLNILTIVKYAGINLLKQVSFSDFNILAGVYQES